MGSFDDAEICEPAGGDKYGKQKVGLNRDDGLTCFGNLNGPQAEKIRKDVIKIFKQEVGLNITRETNLKTVNFLDVTLNLSTGKYQLYSKPGNGPYVSMLTPTARQILPKLSSILYHQSE